MEGICIMEITKLLLSFAYCVVSLSSETLCNPRFTEHGSEISVYQGGIQHGHVAQNKPCNTKNVVTRFSLPATALDVQANLLVIPSPFGWNFSEQADISWPPEYLDGDRSHMFPPGAGWAHRLLLQKQHFGWGNSTATDCHEVVHSRKHLNPNKYNTLMKTIYDQLNYYN